MKKPLSTKVRFRKIVKKGVIKELPLYKSFLSKSFGIQSLESGRISKTVLDQITLLLSRIFKKGSKIIICVHADHAITAKPSEVRMGKGKGLVKDWFAKVRKGTVIFEILGDKVPMNKKFIENISIKFPVRVNWIFFKRF